jgi:hypothetical protein
MGYSVQFFNFRFDFNILGVFILKCYSYEMQLTLHILLQGYLNICNNKKPFSVQ